MPPIVELGSKSRAVGWAGCQVSSKVYISIIVFLASPDLEIWTKTLTNHKSEGKHFQANAASS
jgi:hypothetical protein